MIETPHTERATRAMVVSIPVVCLTVAWATSSVRETIGVANVALVLAALTIVAGHFRWEAGVVSSVVSALSLNYFHTDPVHSLRITSGNDLTMITLLATIGLVVSSLTALRVRRRLREMIDDSRRSSETLLRESMMHPTPAIEAWTTSIRAVGDELAGAEVWFTEEIPSDLPVISRRPALTDVDHDSFVLPEVGAVAYFADPRITGALIVKPRASLGAIRVNREALFSFIHQMEIALR